MTTSEKNSALFTQLILIFHTAAMQHLGKIKNPLTDKIERSLVHAQSAIDMLDMLKERTKGNLSTEEERFLSMVLQELKLNYLDEKNKPEPPAASPAEPPVASPSVPEAHPPSAETTLGASSAEPPVASPSVPEAHPPSAETTLGASSAEPPVASGAEPPVASGAEPPAEPPSQEKE